MVSAGRRSQRSHGATPGESTGQPRNQRVESLLLHAAPLSRTTLLSVSLGVQSEIRMGNLPYSPVGEYVFPTRRAVVEALIPFLTER